MTLKIGLKELSALSSEGRKRHGIQTFDCTFTMAETKQMAAGNLCGKSPCPAQELRSSGSCTICQHHRGTAVLSAPGGAHLVLDHSTVPRPCTSHQSRRGVAHLPCSSQFSSSSGRTQGVGMLLGESPSSPWGHLSLETLDVPTHRKGSTSSLKGFDQQVASSSLGKIEPL